MCAYLCKGNSNRKAALNNESQLTLMFVRILTLLGCSLHKTNNFFIILNRCKLRAFLHNYKNIEFKFKAKRIDKQLFSQSVSMRDLTCYKIHWGDSKCNAHGPLIITIIACYLYWLTTFQSNLMYILISSFQ